VYKTDIISPHRASTTSASSSTFPLRLSLLPTSALLALNASFRPVVARVPTARPEAGSAARTVASTAAVATETRRTALLPASSGLNTLALDAVVPGSKDVAYVKASRRPEMRHQGWERTQDPIEEAARLPSV
jgi:hypothetical protein